MEFSPTKARAEAALRLALQRRYDDRSCDDKRSDNERGLGDCHFTLLLVPICASRGAESDTSPNPAAVAARYRDRQVPRCGPAGSTSGFTVAARCAIPALSGPGLLRDWRSQASPGTAHASTRAESERFRDAL